MVISVMHGRSSFRDVPPGFLEPFYESYFLIKFRAIRVNFS